ncbi:putative heat shock protein Awh11/Hsp9 [Gonapodya prolifera JEL478]|uniref:Putative heat shock protein Awh11/Hsp9 n=1 Tax=Gonapodya prolifera (strain JEL478) TaxID=1344416 RepID=A0A139A8Z2_GONPJ|nr:putative heat shock protein Awh11/Hsp9 [Gonapodya prolifera JEL478]|eukprot:KXS13260.1 putative heat shock protein Awh11/Hsp9 [Gonapodya prolifera JEL478]
MDYGRKGFTEEVKEKVTPDTQKSYTQQVSETVGGYSDRAKSAVTPDSQKSTGQQIHDRARGASDEANRDDRTLMEKAKDALGVDRRDQTNH